MPWQLTTLTGLCTLNNLDLNLIRIYQIKTCDSKSSTSNLLYGRSAGVSIFIWSKTVDIFSAFPGVGFSAKPIHCNCQAFVSFLGNGTIGHGSCFKTFYDFRGRLNFFNRYWIFTKLKFHQTTQSVHFA